MKSCYEQKDTSSADDERLAGRVPETEDVVTADAVLHRAGDVGVLRPPAHRYHYILRRQLLLWPILHRRDNSMRILELSQTIDIFDFLIPQVDPGHPVHGLDVVLYGLCERSPTDFDVL